MGNKRRDFLRVAGAATLAGTLPFWAGLRASSAATPEAFVPDIEFGLVAQPDEVQLLPGRPTAAWRFNFLVT